MSSLLLLFPPPSPLPEITGIGDGVLTAVSGLSVGAHGVAGIGFGTASSLSAEALGQTGFVGIIAGLVPSIAGSAFGVRGSVGLLVQSIAALLAAGEGVHGTTSSGVGFLGPVEGDATATHGEEALMLLQDAFSHVLTFWEANPSGGTRAQLLASLQAAGFAEPLLATWFDLFLQGCVTLGQINAPDYDAELVPKLAAVGAGTQIVRDRAEVVFSYLTTGRSLVPIQTTSLIQTLESMAVPLTAKLANIDLGIAFALANFPVGPIRTDTVDAAQVGRGLIEKTRDGFLAQRDQLQAELAA